MSHLAQSRSAIEEIILAEIIRSPRLHAWELSGLEPRLFGDVKHRAICEAVCFLRDRGARVCSRTVQFLLKPRGLHDFAKQLVRWSFTSHGSMTAYVSELHHLAARKGRAA